MDYEIFKSRGSPAVRVRNIDKMKRTVKSTSGINVCLDYGGTYVEHFGTQEEAMVYAVKSKPVCAENESEEVPKIVRKSKSISFRENALKNAASIAGATVNVVTIMAVAASIEHGYSLSTPSGLGSDSSIDYIQHAIHGATNSLSSTLDPSSTLSTLSPNDVADVASFLWW